MSIKSINQDFMALRDMDMETTTEDDLLRITEPMYEEFSSCAEIAENILKKSVAEKDLVVMMLAVQKAIIASKSAEGGGSALLMADLMNELQPYTHTVVLTVIGILIQDEVL